MGNIPVALYRLTATKTKSNYTTPGFTKLASFVTLDATRLTATSEESYIRKVLFLSEVAKKKKAQLQQIWVFGGEIVDVLQVFHFKLCVF